jgi:hypothetical protein
MNPYLCASWYFLFLTMLGMVVIAFTIPGVLNMPWPTAQWWEYAAVFVCLMAWRVFESSTTSLNWRNRR